MNFCESRKLSSGFLKPSEATLECSFDHVQDFVLVTAAVAVHSHNHSTFAPFASLFLLPFSSSFSSCASSSSSDRCSLRSFETVGWHGNINEAGFCFSSDKICIGLIRGRRRQNGKRLLRRRWEVTEWGRRPSRDDESMMPGEQERDRMGQMGG